MQKFALPMTRDSFARVPDLLREQGITVEPRPRLREFEMLGCGRDGVTVLLSMTQPAHWATASDARGDLVVVAALGESVFRFWRLNRERRLRHDIIEALRPYSWNPSAEQPAE
jgi:hypothetical protein